MRYHYRAKNAAGEVVEGAVEAKDAFALAGEMRKKNLTLLSSSREDAPARGMAAGRFFDRFSRITYADKLQFFDNLATMLSAGLSLSRALAVLSRQAHKAPVRQMIERMIDRITSGDPLADTISKAEGVFSEEAIELVRAGEASGALPATLGRIAATMKRRYDIVRKVRGAMVYPAIVVLLMIAIGFFMLVVVVPPLTQTFQSFNVELPLLTRVIVALGTFVSSHIILTLAGLVLSAFAAYRAFKSARGTRLLHRALLRAPWVAPLTREYYAGASLRTLAALLAAGIDIVEALDITARAVTHYRYKEALIEAREGVQKGVPVHALFVERDDLFPPFVSEMAEVGDETGLLAKMLDQAASVYEEHIAATTKNLSSIIEPLLMVVIGAFVALFAIAVIDPLYSLTDSLK